MTEQGGGYSSLSTGSKDRACDGKGTAGHMGTGKGGSILVHVGTNNADREVRRL